MAHLGDFDTSAVVYGKFTTYRPSTGATFTLGGTPALSVYKDNSTTQSTTGVTLTADFDSVTGLNHFAIDTSADGTFYSAGSFFDIVITTGTVDSVSVTGSVVGSFTIRKNSALKPATAARTLAVDASGRALSDVDTIKTNPVVNGGTATFPTNATLASTTNITAAAGCAVSSIGNNVITAASIAADAITDAKVASDVTIASVTGAVGSVTGAVGSVTGAVGSVTGNVGGNVNGSVGSVVGAVGSVTGNVGGNVSGSVGSVVGAVGSVTGLTAANLDVAVSTRLATAGYTAPLDAAGTRSAVGLASANLDTQLGDLPTAAENAAAALTTAMTESYRADGATGTLAQLLYEINAHLGEAAIVGTTKTINKVDGTTAAATFTLDSDTAPTSITRAT